MLSFTPYQVEIKKTELRNEVERRLRKYIQYSHYHDDEKGWKLAYVEHTIRFKSGNAIAGEYVLIRKSEYPGSDYEIAHLTPGVFYGNYNIEPNVAHCEVSAKTVEKNIVFLE